MIKSFKISLLILFSIFILDKIVYFTLKSIDDKVLTGGVGRINHFFTVKDTTQFVFFGSSRVHHHINPSQFSESAYNMGVGGRNIAYSSTLIKTLPKNKKQFVFLQIDPGDVYDTLYDGSDIKALSIMQHKNSIIRENIKELDMDNPFSAFLWSLDYNGLSLSLITNWLRPKYDYREFDGYEPISNTKEQKEIFVKRLKKIKKGECNDTYSPSELQKKCILEIKEFCEKNNKQLLFFTTPVYKDPCTKDNKALKEMMGGFGVQYIDYTTLFDLNPDLDLWRDENHLSKKGADLFSEIMAKEISKKEK